MRTRKDSSFEYRLLQLTIRTAAEPLCIFKLHVKSGGLIVFYLSGSTAKRSEDMTDKWFSVRGFYFHLSLD